MENLELEKQFKELWNTFISTPKNMGIDDYSYSDIITFLLSYRNQLNVRNWTKNWAEDYSYPIDVYLNVNNKRYYFRYSFLEENVFFVILSENLVREIVNN